jgi:hypothetical protein
MWLILLDASGSMGDPFGGAAEFSGRTRVTDTRVKIDSAKESLVLHLRGLGATTEAAIFVFRDHAELIYEGSSARNEQIMSALEPVKPSGGTSIAAALAAARDHIDAHLDRPFIRVLLISDGLSDAAAAEATAVELQKRRVPIDAILIDPSDQGEELTRRVVGAYGSVSAVTSMSEMASAVGEIGNLVQAEVAAATYAHESLRAAIAEWSPQQQNEEVSFTAAHPSELAKDSWGSLLMFIHLSVLTEEARNRAVGLGRAKGSDVISPSTRGSTRLPRGSEISLTPRIPGFDVNPPSTTITWFEDIQNFEFRIRPSRALAEPIVGEVEATVKGLPVARIPLSILVRPARGPRPGADEPKISTGSAFKTIFASYARTDLDVVRSCAAIYSSLGIYTVIDKDKLIGGQPWRPAIRALMTGTDAFQLFWSKDSSVSPPVHEEILDAIVLQGDRGVGFIRPTYWTEPPPPLPPELSSLNFAFLDVGRMGQLHTVRSAAAAPSKSHRETPLAGAPKIPAAVLPLLPGTSTDINREISADTSYAVAFIEETTGARYYPVPTLLVDRYTIRHIRALQTVDFETLDRERQRALLDWGRVIGSISVAFHVGCFWGQEPAVGVETARRAGFSEAAFTRLRILCEGAAESWLVPAWAYWRRKRDEISDLTSLRDAAAVVVEAAIASDLASAPYLRGRERGLETTWEDWRGELEPLGLNLSGRSSDAELRGSGASFHASLSMLWGHIEPALAAFADRFGSDPKQPDRFKSAVTIANAIIKCLSEPGSRTIDFVQRELDSSSGWRSAQTQLLEVNLTGVSLKQTFLEFGDAFFGAIGTVLRQRIQEAGDRIVDLGFRIPTTAWQRLKAANLADRLVGSEVEEPWRRDDDVVQISGPVSGFLEGLDGAWTRAKAILVGRSRVVTSDYFITADVPTYGIFAPAAAGSVDAYLQSKALEWGVRRDLVLPGTDRVLLCGESLDDFRALLTERGEHLNVARLFLRGVLVHEHFHAFLETAPTNDGRPPAGPGFLDHWNAAKPVNEALAAWMQVHMARDDQALSAMIAGFVSAGSYHEWPYAGALTIESVFKKKGIKEIRSLINTLRSDPLLALAWMEKHQERAKPSSHFRLANFAARLLF